MRNIAMPIDTDFLTPVLALIGWTILIWIWMYATRIPAMQAAKINPDDARHPNSGWAAKIPATTRAIADNYNHLHEQPTIFYALMFYIALTGGGDGTAAMIAWAYVGLRIIHSLVQILSPKVMIRFIVFVLASLSLLALFASAVFA
jgi:hypothetical protein